MGRTARGSSSRYRKSGQVLVTDGETVERLPWAVGRPGLRPQAPGNFERVVAMEEKISKTEARQGTGPRQMVSVLFVSMALAILAGGFLLWYFFLGASPPAR